MLGQELELNAFIVYHSAALGKVQCLIVDTKIY